jgi:hypothetical protein
MQASATTFNASTRRANNMTFEPAWIEMDQMHMFSLLRGISTLANRTAAAWWEMGYSLYITVNKTHLRTAPIPLDAPVNKTVLPASRDALKTDIFRDGLRHLVDGEKTLGQFNWNDCLGWTIFDWLWISDRLEGKRCLRPKAIVSSGLFEAAASQLATRIIQEAL